MALPFSLENYMEVKTITYTQELQLLWDAYKAGKIKDMNSDMINMLVYGNAVPAPVPVAKAPWPVEQKAAIKKKAKTMCYECDDDFCSHPQSDESKQRMYLENRLSGITSEKRADAYKAFGLQNDAAPTNAEDLIKRIKEGKFTYDEKAAGTGWRNIFSGITWRDPDLKEDKAGFEAYEEKLYAERTKALDAIKIAPPADGLKALQAFEAWDPIKSKATKN